VITRAYLHVTGPVGSGKTTFVEALLGKIDAWILVARCVRDDALREARESVPAQDPELARYAEAGADGVARFAFPSGSEAYEDFFLTDLMADYSEAVVLEGDSPLAHVDLRVSVAPPLPDGGSLFVRTRSGASGGRGDPAEVLERLLDEPGGLECLLAEQLGPAFAESIRRHPDKLHRFRVDLLAGVRRARRRTSKAPPARWALAPGYAGIERAQLVVVNVRDEGERQNGARLVADLARLRKDDRIFSDILAVHGTRIPITAVVADLADPGDPGLKKAVARVKRAIRAANPG
jgi:hypothetical protein